MALFVDGPACTIDDLTNQDAGLLDVALGTNINVSTKLRLAMEEIQTDLQLWLNRPRPTIGLAWVPTLHIGQVVATPPLKCWETMHALALVYRDAYFSQLVDRYQAKWQEYANLARGARESFIASGFGLVSDPVPQAAPPDLATTPGPQSGGTFYACVCWVNSTNQEGAPSEPASVIVKSFNVYRGTNPQQFFRIASAQAPASSFIDTGLPLLPVLPADPQLDHVNMYWRWELVPEAAATVASSSAIGNSALEMKVNEYQSAIVRITRGAGAGQEYAVVSNTATTLSIGVPWATQPDTTSFFVVAENTWTSAGSGSASPITFDVPERIGSGLRFRRARPMH
jgi:hypothetical protein